MSDFVKKEDAIRICKMCASAKYRVPYIEQAFDDAPSIDIVRCKECRWAKANGTYQWCGRLDSTARITADDFCSYGERKDNE